MNELRKNEQKQQEQRISDMRIKSLLKSTEEMVTKARLDQIAREHKSIGNILDNRTIFEVEEPKRKARKASKFEVEKRMRGRRGARVEPDIKEESDKAMDSFRKRGINVTMMTGDYKLEHQIWKQKSTPLSYSQKRKYQNPELQQFKDDMNEEQRKLYKDRVCEALIALADRYRKECRELKADMDQNGIFHPEANAHRVHCMYLMKLFKGISCEALEDPVLRALRREQLQKAYKERSEQLKKEAMLRNLVAAEDPTHAVLKEELPLPVLEEPDFEEEPTDKRSVPIHLKLSKQFTSSSSNFFKEQRETQKEQKLQRAKRISPVQRKSRTLPNPVRAGTRLQPLDSINSSGVGRRSKKASLSNTLHASTSASATIHHLGLDGAGSTFGLKSDSGVEGSPGGRGQDSDDRSQSNSHEKTPHGGPKQPDKLFKLMKRERLGAVDSRVLLTSEAAKLDSAEVLLVKKHKDKNTLLEDEMSDWMLSNLQKHQITRTAGGGAMLPTGSLSSDVGQHHPTTAWAAQQVAVQQQAPSEFTKLLAKAPLQQQEGEQSLLHSPQRMLPFDQFYAMFREYGSHTQSQTTSPMASPTPAEAPGPTNTKEPLLATDDLDTPTPAPGPSESPKAAIIEQTAEKGLPKVESTNLLKKMVEVDPGFDRFLKLAPHMRSNEAGEKTALGPPSLKGSSSSLTKLRPTREAIPLGKEAVQLTDSRGRTSKLASKGFGNVFLPKDKRSVDMAADREVDDPLAMAFANRMLGIVEDDDSSTSSGHQQHSREEEEEIAQIHTPSRRARMQRRLRGRPKSRESQRSHSDEDEDEDDFASRPATGASGVSGVSDQWTDADEPGVQDKLLATWNCLQVSAQTRFAFMRKYSTAAYLVEMGKAVDIWAEAAVLIVSTAELLKLTQKIKANLYVLPLESKGVIRLIRKKVPPLLASTDPQFIPPVDPTTNTPKTTAPLSAAALTQVRAIIRNSFKAATHPKQDEEGPEAKQFALGLVTGVLDQVVLLLEEALRRAHKELDDGIPYGTKSCREWLFGLGLGAEVAAARDAGY